MYEAHYGFSEKPFNLTPDPKYLYLSAHHTEAFAHLDFGHRERGGFVVITGEVGTGKTTLARYFLSRLDERTSTAVVLYPALSAAELLRAILDDLQAPVRGDSPKSLVDSLHRYLLEARQQSRNVVLLIDEAQSLAAEVLEQVRLISNLETDTEKLIQIVLMGQSELRDVLARHDLRQLAQRVTARYHLTPLSQRETADYVAHRIAVADGAGKVQFTLGALSVVHRRSGGIPRLINQHCDRALLAGYVQGTRTIDVDVARRAARELSVPGAHRRWFRPLAAGLAAVGLIASATLLIPQPGGQPADVEARVPAPPPPPEPDPLEPRLLDLSGPESLQAAREAVRGTWDPGPVEEISLRSHMRQLRRLDLPAVLELFHVARQDPCYVALLGIGADDAWVRAGEGAPIRVSLEELDAHWTRSATFFWRDFEGIGSEIDAPREELWLRAGLERAGVAAPSASLRDAVARFQRLSDLEADGLVGSRTLMTLYSLDPGYPRPRLGGGAS